jgi:hypothetical protein
MNPPETDISFSNAALCAGRNQPRRQYRLGRARHEDHGFSDLVLVTPRCADPLRDPEAVAFASGAIDVLEGARIVGSIAEALEGCNFAAAVSARLREFSPPVWTPRPWPAMWRQPALRRPDFRQRALRPAERDRRAVQCADQYPGQSRLFLAEPVAGGPGAGLRMPAGAAEGENRTQEAHRLPGRGRQPGPDRGHVRPPGRGAGGDRLPERRQSPRN